MTTRTADPPLPPLPPRRKVLKPEKAVRSPLMPLAIVAVVVTMLVFAGMAVRPPWGQPPVSALFVFPLVLALGILLTRRAAREEQRFDLRSIMVIGIALRGIGAALRYSAPVDANVYHSEGIRIAEGIRNFDLYPDPGRSIPGTGWIRYFSGVVHVLDFDDMMATFLVFTFLAFVGAFLCYRAFTHAVPNGNHRRYALLVFLWPSLVYWPSSLGKEAWMIFGIGVASWGVSRFLTGRAAAGLLVGTLGIVILSLVRPHVALMVLVGFAVALFARPAERKTSARLVARLLSIVLLLIGGSYVAARASQLLKNEDDITLALDSTVAQTEQGGAAFKASVVRTPLDYPEGFVTVWFRPFPTEARGGGAPQLASSFENMVFLGLILASWRRILDLPRALVRIPYVTYAMTYAAAFVYAFSAIGNFGILARQRTQGMILFFVILCLPELTNATKSRMVEGRQGRAERMRARLLQRRKPMQRTRRSQPYRERAAARSADP